MSDKMRELFLEKFLVPRYGRVIATGYADRLDTPDTLWVQQDCWEAWQAAQSVLVPVAGDVVAWDNFPGYLLDHQEGSMVTEENLQFWLSAFIKNTDYNKPTTSITAAELSDLIELVISAQGYTDEKLLNLMKRVMP